MNKLNEIIDWYPDEELLKADGFDDAVIGVAYDKVTGGFRLVYSISKCIKILIDRDKMTYEMAMEYFDFNVQDAYVGEQTPIWVDDEMFNEATEEFKTFDDIETNDGETED
jgi:hypothetical protein